MATIGLDLDCVTYPDFLSRFARFIERHLQLPDFALNCEAVEWDLKNCWPDIADASIRALLAEFTHEGLFAQGALSPGLGHFIRRWKQEGHRVVFITARTCTHASHGATQGCEKLHKDTFQWMREVGLSGYEVYFATDKHSVKCDLLVDDLGGNLIDHNSMVRLLWHQPHNRTQSHPQFIRVTEWREVDYYVSTLPKE